MTDTHRTAEQADLTVLSWNLWFGGGQIREGRAKQLALVRRYLAEDPAPVLLLQESVGADLDLAHALGWNVVSGPDTAILSPLELEAVPDAPGSYANGAIVHASSGPVLLWSAHLDHRDYGPYFTGIDRPDRVAALIGESRRAEQAATILARTEALVRHHGDLPVVLGGDFNVPATDDWAARRLDDDAVGRGLRWAATDAVLEAGFSDAFRALWPDPVGTPGLTWSPIEPAANEPRDRIDFVYARGLVADEARHLGSDADGSIAGPELIEVGGPARLIPGHGDNAWPSDHLAVLARFRA